MVIIILRVRDGARLEALTLIRAEIAGLHRGSNLGSTGSGKV